jgi:hypothetical protein
MKVLVAMRVPGTDAPEVIQVHRRYLVELMQQWTRIKEAEAGSDLSLALVVDAELFRLDSVIGWLDAADGRIKRSAPAPAELPAPAPRRGCAAASGPGDETSITRRIGDGVLRHERPKAAERVADLRPGGRRGARAERH